MRSILFFIIIFAVLVSTSYGEMYKWVDEKGTVHFTDDLSSIPEKFRQNAETRKPPKEISTPQAKEKPQSTPPPKSSETGGMTIDLLQKGELSLVEVILNGRVKQHFIVDTGASFTVMNRSTAKELGITIDENTPFLPIFTASSLIFTPLVTLKSLQVGHAEVENVDVLIHDMPSHAAGLLGNSFLNKFKVMIDSFQGKMVLFPMQGMPSPDRPGGYGRDFWVGQFRFYHRVLEELKKTKRNYEGRGPSSELTRVNNAVRYFENQLSELERKASLAGVPRNWRE
jgi:clan AA aspartic protease (TIGR02281 family)